MFPEQPFRLFLITKPIKTYLKRQKNKVLKAVQELGYKPDQRAIELAKTCRYKIGLMVDVSESFHYSDVCLSQLFEAMYRRIKQNRDKLFYLPFNFNTLPIDKAFALDLDAEG